MRTQRIKFADLGEECHSTTLTVKHLKMKHRHEHAFGNHYSSNQFQMENLPPYAHLRGTCHLRDVEYWRPPGFCPLHPLPAPVPWTACCLRLTPVSHHTVTSTKLLILFYSPTESLRPVTSSSAWNQDQQHKDDFPASWLTGSFSLHIHTLFPVSLLLVTGYVLSGGIWFLKA